MNAIINESNRRAIRIWLTAVAALIFAMVVVGGATRLTESGLSITEWQPIDGVLPPLGEAEWQAQFDMYKAIPQYQALNPTMTLAAFKTIFWWEWAHRLLARVIGFAFLLPFLWFLWHRMIARDLWGRLWLIFGIGAVQAGVGWWMVSSGLSDRTEVSPYRLAFHLTLACLIYVAVLWTAQEHRPSVGAAAPRRLRLSARLVLALVFLQIYLGALVAGLRAGLIYNTWPLIDGTLWPAGSQLLFARPWWRNFFENPLTAQFDHRLIAYVVLTAALLHAADAARTLRGAARWGALALGAAVLLQATLGIVTLLAQAPLGLALMHQGMAVIVLTFAVLNAERMGESARRLAPERAAELGGFGAHLSEGRP